MVTDEVRKLAKKTMPATKEMRGSVTAIQHGANEAINETGETSQLVNKSTEFVQQAGQALRGILNIVDTTADQIRAIAAASEGQSVTSEEINRNIEEVNEIAAKTSQSTQQSTQAVHGLGKLAEEMVSLIAKLKQNR